MTSTTSQAFFEAKYVSDTDPWDFATSDYELKRYSRILHACGGQQFELGYEPGCSVGVLTQKLASRCERIEACDISPTAVKLAQNRCQHLQNVRIQNKDLANFLPLHADLYVFAEVGYYLLHAHLEELLQRDYSALRDNATWIACHWRGHSTDHILRGDEVHEAIHRISGLEHTYSEVHDDFRLDRWVKRGPTR